MAEKSYICKRVFLRSHFRALQAFEDMDVLPNVMLLLKVAIFFVHEKLKETNKL